MNNLETKIKIVRNGESKVFMNWSEHSGIEQDQFIEGLEWLCADPCDGGAEGNGMTRELGLDVKAKKIVRLRRTYFGNGSFDGFYDIDSAPVAPGLYSRWEGNISISCRDRI